VTGHVPAATRVAIAFKHCSGTWTSIFKGRAISTSLPAISTSLKIDTSVHLINSSYHTNLYTRKRNDYVQLYKLLI
jgi:hypothetical protein